ncbi:phosphoenolpyruvate--protein phosphotransferase [Geopsychrobacter electrodiphilus]|uniref:phosphoenolpyruvate--protein phosphotransferase n=1 Tax=Geopsychrobacter electrodiphilus TaxID=225196 RepID=UPI00037DBA9B|nr:phosphoenolpyruvate--protein phosphotransferase [Geopsychrobacter electrodiphilus]
MGFKNLKKSDKRLGLSTLQDISTIILQSHHLNETLENIVTLVAERAHSEVCSLYLLDDNSDTLVLRATCGLAPESVGRVKLKIGEGLTGLAAQQRSILSIEEPQSDPRYRYFAGTGEEQFHSFLAIPLFDRNEPLGVMVIQTLERRVFTEEETSTLSTIAFQVSSIVVNARLLDTIDRQQEPSEHPSLPAAEGSQPGSFRNSTTPGGQTVLRGKVAYPGVIVGPANLINDELGFSDVHAEYDVNIEQELARLDEALRKTRIATLYLEKRVAERLTQADAAIFHTHLMILEDRGFIEKLHELIDEGHSAPYALKKVIRNYLEAFGKMEDAYLRERAADMEDIGRRLLSHLLGQKSGRLHLQHTGILVAHRLLPSDMASIDHDKISGLIIESNETNAHSVIMAKALGIPALIGVQGAMARIEPGAELILDANSGCVFLNPNATILDEYFRLEFDLTQEKERLNTFRDKPALTQDGQRIQLRANIGLLSDIEIAKRNGAEGVGLYRTEFPYMARSNFPNRDDQYQLYRKVIEEFSGAPVTIRTLDIGGDKALPYFNHPKEDNPFMGWRSIRISLDHKDVFQTQIEAILMAGVHGPTRLLFPLISNIEEIRACRKLVVKAMAHLQEEKIEFLGDIPIGAMIEVPAALRLAPHLANEVDFFALGTNDLIQYLLAADRSNSLVQSYYDPLHPAVLGALADLANVARNKKIDLCLCGEMSSDNNCLYALIGLGIDQFSLSAPYIPHMKDFISKISREEAQGVAAEILQMSSSKDIRKRLARAIKKFS